jgi:hypothetical protein
MRRLRRRRGVEIGGKEGVISTSGPVSSAILNGVLGSMRCVGAGARTRMNRVPECWCPECSASHNFWVVEVFNISLKHR